MTICIGVIDDTGCTLAADGLGTSACVEYHRIQKIQTYKGITFAIAGALTGIEVMQEAIDAVLSCDPSGVIRLPALSAALRGILGERGWTPDSDRGGRPPYWDLSFLLTDGYHLAVVNSDMTVTLVDEDMETIGVGNEVAVGAFRQALKVPGKTGHEAAWDAVLVAAEFSSGCGGQSMRTKITSDKPILKP